MKIRGFLPIKILVCAMLIGGIACSTVVKGDELGAPRVAESNEPSASLIPYNEPPEEAAPPGEPQGNSQDETECKEPFLWYRDRQTGEIRWDWPSSRLVARVLENPAIVEERFLREIIDCEPRTLFRTDEMKNKLIERTYRLIDMTRELDKKDDQYSLLYEDYEKARSRIGHLESIIEADRFKLNDFEDQIQRAGVVIGEYDAYLGDLVRQAASQQIDEETRGAIVGVSVKLDTTFAEFERIFGGPLPPGAGLSEPLSMHWITFGTLVDMGKFGNKVIIMRHALYRGMPEDLNTLNSLTMSIIEPQAEAQHAISFDGIREFPELDLVVLDAPSSLKAKPLPIGDVDPYRTPLVSHVYDDDRVTLYSQLVQIRPLRNEIVLSPSEKWITDPDNFMSVSGRIINRDSGGPLVLKENGERKVVGFITHRVLGKDGGGIAVKASRLLDKFEEYEFQRPQ